jgi:hypothetical protein
MTHSPINISQLTLAMLRTELNANAFIMTMHRCGFTTDYNLSDLSMEIMELIGFTANEGSGSSRDDLMYFYVEVLDALTEHYIDHKTPIEETAQEFYRILLAEKVAREK